MLADCASTFDVGMDFTSLFLSCPGTAGKKDILLAVKCLYVLSLPCSSHCQLSVSLDSPSKRCQPGMRCIKDLKGKHW